MVIPTAEILDARDVQNGALNVVAGLGVQDADETFLKLAFSRLLQDHLVNLYGIPIRSVIFFDTQKKAVAVRVFYQGCPRHVKSYCSAFFSRSKSMPYRDSINFEYSPISRVKNVAQIREYPKQILLAYSFKYDADEPQWGVI